MKIGELARRAGVSVQTIRYYETHRIIPKADRTDSGYRVYDENTVELLVFIKNAQELGFTLEKIKRLLDIRNDENSKGIRVKVILQEEIAEIDGKIESLNLMREYLLNLNNGCGGEMPAESCPILQGIQSGIKIKGELK